MRATGVDHAREARRQKGRILATTVQRCGVDHDHPLSLVEDLGDGRQVMECTNGCGEFVLDVGTGCLDPVRGLTDGGTAP